MKSSFPSLICIFTFLVLVPVNWCVSSSYGESVIDDSHVHYWRMSLSSNTWIQKTSFLKQVEDPILDGYQSVAITSELDYEDNNICFFGFVVKPAIHELDHKPLFLGHLDLGVENNSDNTETLYLKQNENGPPLKSDPIANKASVECIQA